MGENKGEAPVIGDNVILSTGCKIIGGIKIGDNAFIGPNVVVVRDVESNKKIVTGKNRELN